MEASADFVKLKGRKTNNYAYLYPIEAGGELEDRNCRAIRMRLPRWT